MFGSRQVCLTKRGSEGDVMNGSIRLLCVAGAVAACAGDPGGGGEASTGWSTGTPAEPATSSGAASESDGGGSSSSGGEDPPDPEEPEDDAIRITHAFGSLTLGPYEDDASTARRSGRSGEQLALPPAVALRADARRRRRSLAHVAECPVPPRRCARGQGPRLDRRRGAEQLSRPASPADAGEQRGEEEPECG